MRYLLAYLSMRLDGAGHLGAKQYAQNCVKAARRERVERRGCI